MLEDVFIIAFGFYNGFRFLLFHPFSLKSTGLEAIKWKFTLEGQFQVVYDRSN